MRWTTSRLGALMIALGVGASGPLAAGTVLTYQEDAPANNHMTISFQGNHLRVDFGTMAMLFNGANAATQVELNTTAKQYIEMHFEAPPGPAPGSPEKPLPFYKHVAERVKVGLYWTDAYQVLGEGRRLMDLWVADPAELHIDPADTVIFPGVRKRLATVPVFSEIQYIAGEGAPSGVPVKVVMFAQGGKPSVLQLTHVSQETLPAATFEVPSGYARTKAPPAPH
jgi:hypothetical protein